MPESYRVRLKPEILRLTGLFVDLLQLIAMNIWLFHQTSTSDDKLWLMIIAIVADHWIHLRS
ncbi:hypothetical protein DERP_012326 [Dermatophagoides pteronyssinus]|uniref:Uncharacterized protein n=1 Tax=Dermatophagoides pteronyssinus TaxID=6956 RepID=A0ABQ8JQG1_DERPT|nr:hypothetical protein DERP_012326 [Dermatophagoides pteronyssinus]